MSDIVNELTNVQGDQTPDKIEEPKSYLADLVGEGRKYSDEKEAAEALAKKAVHADQHIENILGEKKALEQQLAEMQSKIKSTEEIVDAINLSYSKQEEQPPGVGDLPTDASLDQDGVKEAVRNYFLEEEAKKIAEERKSNMVNVLSKAYGSPSAAADAIKAYVGDDKEKEQVIDRLAIVDPEAVVKMVGVPESVQLTEEHGTDLPKGTEVDEPVFDWEYCKRIKRENPSLYNSLNFQMKISRAEQTNPNFYKK